MDEVGLVGIWLNMKVQACCLGEIQKIRENLGPRQKMTHVRETEMGPFLLFFFFLPSSSSYFAFQLSFHSLLSVFIANQTRLSSFIYVMKYTASFLLSALISFFFFFFFFAFFSNCVAAFGNYSYACVRQLLGLDM